MFITNVITNLAYGRISQGSLVFVNLTNADTEGEYRDDDDTCSVVIILIHKPKSVCNNQRVISQVFALYIGNCIM